LRAEGKDYCDDRDRDAGGDQAVFNCGRAGIKVHVIADACGDVSNEAHERAIERTVQAGARPMTSLQYLLELQRDWARTETYDATTGLARTFGGAYGIGIIYAKTMLGPHASEAGKAA
jgi:nicotinamidase-related amidase